MSRELSVFPRFLKAQSRKKIIDLFDNLAVLSQVALNLPHMAANSLFFRGNCSETEVSEQL
jgi:hypothetical protein